MREEIIVQGQPLGYMDKDELRAFLTEDAPASILDDLLDAGYAVCISNGL